MSVEATIDRLVSQYGHANADDISKDWAIAADADGSAAFWTSTGYSDARTQGMVRCSNLMGSMAINFWNNEYYAARDRDEAIAMVDRIVPLNEAAKAELLRIRALLGAPEEVEVAA